MCTEINCRELTAWKCDSNCANWNSLSCVLLSVNVHVIFTVIRSSMSFTDLNMNSNDTQAYFMMISCSFVETTQTIVGLSSEILSTRPLSPFPMKNIHTVLL